MSKIKIPAAGPIILILGGGGSKGAWTCGFLQYMWEMIDGFKDRVVVIKGTSTGSLIGALTGRAINSKKDSYFYELLNIYRTVQDGNIMSPRDKIAHQLGGVQGLLLSSLLQGRDSLFDTSPLIELVDQHMDGGWRALGAVQSTCDVGFCTVNMETGLSEMWNGSEKMLDELRLALIASASQPLLMNPVLIKGVQHCDGGLIDATPVRFAWDHYDQYKDATVLCLSPDKRKGKASAKQEFDSVPDQLERTLSIMVNNVSETNYQIAQGMQLERPFGGGVHWIEPTHHIGMEALRFKQPAMEKWVNRGFAQAAKTVDVALEV